MIDERSLINLPMPLIFLQQRRMGAKRLLNADQIIFIQPFSDPQKSRTGRACILS